MRLGHLNFLAEGTKFSCLKLPFFPRQLLYHRNFTCQALFSSNRRAIRADLLRRFHYHDYANLQPLISHKLRPSQSCLTVAEDTVEEDVEEDVEEEVVVILTGTIIMAAAAVTTPVATPMGMTTYGLESVVKLDAFSLS